MFRRQYKPQVKEKEELGIFGKSLQPKRQNSAKWTVDPNFADDQQRNHLHLGVLKYCVDDKLFESALKGGCEVNAQDEMNYSPLHYAAEKGLVTCVDRLIKKGAVLDKFSSSNLTSLMLACKNGHPTVVKSLVKAGANVNLTNTKGELALHFSCGSGHQECAEILLKYKSKINYPDNEGNTPLTLACQSCKTKIVQALIEKGVRVDKEDSMGRTPLHWAVLAGNRDMVRLLLEQDVMLDVMDKQFSTPFLYSIFMGKPDILGMLLDAGCDRSTIDGLNGTAMALASLKGLTACVQTLLNAGEDPNEFSYFGMTALMAAVYESRCDVTEILLKGGADPSIVSRMGFTPLLANLCCMKSHNAPDRHKQAVLLLQYGSDINFRMNSASVFTSITNGKNCPMSFAICSGYVSLVRMFLYAGSDIKCSEIRELIKIDNTEAFYDLETLLGPIKEYRRNPVPLVHACRLTIRKALGKSCITKIEHLPIAPALKKYLNFYDLMQIEPEYASNESRMSDYLMTFVSVKPCGLGSLKGSFLYDTIEEPVRRAQGGAPCNCDICERIRARSAALVM